VSTTSQYVNAKSTLVTLLTAGIITAGLTAEAHYAWPGAATPPDCIFLGRHPDLVPNPLTASSPFDSEDPVMKMGRRQRQQEFDIEATIWSFRPDLSPDDAQEAETGGFALFDVFDGVIADNPRLGLSSLQSAELTSAPSSLVPFQKGWASVIVPTVRIKSRLT
jgi:hypothetical protein